MKPKQSGAGFTLIEIIVVIVILAVLSLIGLAFFGGTITQQAKKTQGIADVKAMAQALELNYDRSSDQYIEFTDSDFASGSKPIPSDGIHYSAFLTSDGKGFRVCANLSQPTICNSSDNCYCYCVSSGQSSFDNTQEQIIIYER